jgi:hypothetical protein
VKTLVSSLLAGVCLGGCVQVNVVGPRSSAHAAPKPPDCRLEIYRQRPPGAPFEELGDLELSASTNTPDAALQALREKACSLGADAMIITQEFTRVGDSATMRSVAVRYRGTTADPLHPAPSRF